MQSSPETTDIKEPELHQSEMVPLVEGDLIPLSFAQQRIWFFDQLQPNSALYNIPTAIHLRGLLKLNAMEKSLNTILSRHEALRTNFVAVNGEPIQVIREKIEIKIPVFDLNNMPLADRESECAKILQAEARKPFDLARDVLLRAALIRLAPEEHILFLNMHHIVSDEWSLRVFFAELSKLYNGFCVDAPPRLPEVPVQFADYALWERDFLSNEVIQRETNFWKQQLGANLKPLELPADKPRPLVQSYRGAMRSLSLPDTTLSRLKQFCRSEGVTLFNLTLAAFKALLHRYTLEENIVIGSPISGRNNIETENLIGFFVNTLLLRTHLSGDMTFSELLSSVRTVTIDAFAHQELPFDKLVEELHPDRNAGQLSIAQTMFALQNASEHHLELAGLETRFLDIETGTAKFDLTFVVREETAGLTLHAEFNTDLFERETIDRMLKHYWQLLESALLHPHEKLSFLKLLDDAERQLMLVEWNQTASSYPENESLPERFSKQAQTTPNAIAVQYGDERVTYRELEERSNQLARYLKKNGVAPGSPVCISVERSIEMIVGFLGILKTGGAYVPLDPDYPAERLSFMLEDTQSPILITQSKFAPAFAQMNCQKLFIDSDWAIISSEEKSPSPTQQTGRNLAYVIYTSGSTGQPKGVAVPQNAIMRLVFNTNYIQLSAEERIAQLSNSSFDAATFEIWGALLHGGTLIGFEKNLVLSPRDFARQIKADKISTIFLTTALFNQIAADAPSAFSGVTNVLFGGEAVDPKSVSRILREGRPQRLLHVYGPTESTTFASWFEIKAVPENATTIPIGKPLSNTTFYVLDRQLQPVPIGVPGELHIGGNGLARGYFNRPDLTAARFVPNPFSADSSERIYKTGDLVRYLPDGNIEFIGRVDHQVKIRGFRIELQEIETQLKQHPDVRDAIVIVVDHNGDKRLIGYALTESQNPEINETIRNFLKQKLPAYMVPSAIVTLEHFPLNPNGKIDRPALPRPSSSETLPEERPLTPLEEQLREIWKSVIGRDSIHLRDNFFDLGGHSLLAVKLFAQIEKQLGKKLSLGLLFQAPTIEQLARAINEEFSPVQDPCLIEIQPHGNRPPIFWLHTLGGGGGGGVLRYQKLAQLLGEDQPSYGLVAPPEPFTRIEAMAAHYIKSMKRIQPAGPYHLGGYCFGGVVAFEMAQQLHQAGEEIALLALLDSFPPNQKNEQVIRLNFGKAVASLPGRIVRLLSKDRGHLSNALKRRLKKLKRRLSSSPSDASDAASLDDVIDMANYPADYKRYAEVHWNALVNYFPKFYPGTATLLETTQSSAPQNPSAVWKALVGHLDLRRIAATHETMLEDLSVSLVASEIKKCLRSNDKEPEKCAA